MRILFAIILELALFYKYNGEGGNELFFKSLFPLHRKLGKGTNTCVGMTGLRKTAVYNLPLLWWRRVTADPLGIQLPSLRKSWLHWRDLVHMSRTRDQSSHGAKRKHSMVTALPSWLASGVIHLWPGGIVQRRQVRAVTMAHSYWKSGTPTCWL